MNNKLLIGVILLILIFGVATFFVGGSKTQQPSPVQQTQNNLVSPTPAPTGPSQAQAVSPISSAEQDQVLQGQAIVTLTTTGFLPQKIKIKTGTRVIFINQSGASASVNSDPYPVNSLYPPLNLGQFDNGSSLQLIFDKQGTYSYHNHLNPEMTGSVTVVE